MKKIWNVINEACGSFLAWIDREAVAFWIALALSVLGFLCAQPNEGIPVLNVALLALAVGVLTMAILLEGSCIVLNKSYNTKAFLYSCVGAFIGTLACLGIALI